MLRKLKVISLYIFEIQEQLLSRNNSFFSEWKLGGFWNRKSNVMYQIKPHFSYWLKINFRKMASNKNVDLRKIENFVRSKSKGIRKKFLCNGNKKRNLLQSQINVSACPHVKFLCLATFFLKFFVAEAK